MINCKCERERKKMREKMKERETDIKKSGKGFSSTKYLWYISNWRFFLGEQKKW